MNDYLLPPGKVLKMYLTHNKTTQKRLALETGMTQSYISEVIHGKAKITPYFAVRLEAAFGFNATSAEYWLDLEKHYQIKSERRKRYEWKKQKENEKC